MHKTQIRKFVLALIAAAVVAVSVFGAAGPASAHANLLFTNPASDTAVAAMPRVITLVFDQPVTIDKVPVKLTGPSGPVNVGSATLRHGGTSVEVPVPVGQSAGIYRVNWQVTGADGDVMDGIYPFAVGPVAMVASGQATAGTGGAWETAILRGLLFAATALSLGELGGLWLLRRNRNRHRVRSWIPWAAMIGMAASIGLAVLLLGNGSLIAGLTRPAAGTLTSRPGIVTLVEVSAFATTMITARTRRASWSWLPLIAIVGAEALRAHPGTVNLALGVPLTVLHLGGATLWGGTLVYILRTALAWRREPASSRAALVAYSRPAIWLFGAVAVTGLSSALLLLPVSDILSTDYGRVLLVKVALVSLAAAFAWIARRRQHRNASVQSVIRPARLESISLASVLVLSAALTVLPPPADPNAPLPFAPPANGLTVPVATLAGSIQVNAQASAGQLVVHVNAPRYSNFSSRPATPATSLSGALADPSGRTTQLTFRDCGAGCFYTPTTWKKGSSQLTLSPVIEGWESVTTGLTIEWPAGPANDLLGKVIAAMRTVDALTLYERVTGSSTQGRGELRTFQMSGTEFVRRALFASGKVPAVVRLPDVRGNQRLVISYPAESAVDELTIAPDGRILSETLTSSNIVSHTFVYPEAETGNK